MKHLQQICIPSRNKWNWINSFFHNHSIWTSLYLKGNILLGRLIFYSIFLEAGKLPHFDALMFSQLRPICLTQPKSRVGTPGMCRNWLALRGPNGPQVWLGGVVYRTQHIHEKDGVLGENFWIFWNQIPSEILKTSQNGVTFGFKLLNLTISRKKG